MISVRACRSFSFLGKRRLSSGAQGAGAKFNETYGAFIRGVETIPEGSTKFAVSSPFNGEKLCDVVSTDVKLARKVIDDAHEAFESGVWSQRDVRERAKVLGNIAELLRANIPRLAEMEVYQTGRAIKEMNAQLGRLPEWFEYFGALIRTYEGSLPPFFGPYVNYVKRVPVGVCGLITPWNHPMLIAIKKIAPALATGNSVVVKPSELAPVTVVELAKLCTEAGLPKNVLSVLPGVGPTIGQELCRHPYIRKVDLTGGTSTGRAVGAAAGANLAGVVSELGGKAPMIIFDDADIEQAINGAAFATFVATGQTCIMGARVLVHANVYDKFMDALVEKVKRIRLGDPLSFDTQMGPVISEGSRQRIKKMVDSAIGQGATVLTGGNIPTMNEPLDRGYYYSPTILRVTTQMDIWHEEVFGPVLVAVPFQDEEEAVALANDSPYGLAAAVWTKDVMRAHRVADRLNVGIIWINDHHRNDPSSPWGGMKDSGIGRENGLSALHEYTQTKSVVVRTDPSPFDWFEQKDARYS